MFHLNVDNDGQSWELIFRESLSEGFFRFPRANVGPDDLADHFCDGGAILIRRVMGATIWMSHLNKERGCLILASGDEWVYYPMLRAAK